MRNVCFKERILSLWNRYNILVSILISFSILLLACSPQYNRDNRALELKDLSKDITAPDEVSILSWVESSPIIR